MPCVSSDAGGWVKPVILTIVDGLGLNFWEIEQPAFPDTLPTLFILNSEAEEANAALTLLKTKYKNIFVEKTQTRKSRGAALAYGLEKANALGFTHAITIQNLSQNKQNKEVVERLLAKGKDNPNAIILQGNSDTRRLYPLKIITKAIKNHNLGLGFESQITKTLSEYCQFIPLPGKPEKVTFVETLYASFLGLIKR